MVCLLVPLGLLLLARFSVSSDFSYDGTHGPSHWGEEYQTCVGKHQSPINIEEHNVKNVSYEPLSFIGLENPRSSHVLNNGHTVMLRTNESEAAMVSGGPLGKKTYVFEQLHFHWGANDWEGSEDLINNHSFAMELHAVFYNNVYKSMAEAMKHPDGLTVLAYFYEAGNDTNPTYTPIVDVLSSMISVGTKYALQAPLLLSRLLVPDPSTMENYFTYEGSLTTPPCLEIVTWIDFKEPQMLSHDQLAAFRDIQSVDGHKLTHNFRPIQPLDDRIVYHNIASETVNSTKGDSRGNYKNPDEEQRDSGEPSLRASALLISLAALLGSLIVVRQ